MRQIIATVSFFALAACGLSGQDNDKEKAGSTGSPAAAAQDNLADSMASHDGTPEQYPDSEERPEMRLQVVLDRKGFGPGVIDGKMGLSTENALRGFQEANGLTVTGKPDEATMKALQIESAVPATRIVTIPADWGQEPYYAIPDDAADQAKMKRLGYVSLDERLAERFHTTVEVLKMLNPGGKPAGAPAASGTSTSPSSPPPTAKVSAKPSDPESDDFTPQPGPASVFMAGQQIRVPNIGGDRIAAGAVDDNAWQTTLRELGVGTEQPKVSRIVVSKKGGTLKGYDEAGKLLVLFTVTTGSKHDPLPLGDWEITGVGRNPTFAYNPELFWDVADHEEKQQLPAGPNGPVGVVWIDLSKEHYGIHGTPEPQTIGRSESHGCVRLTNWDAARLAQMVSTRTKVEFIA